MKRVTNIFSHNTSNKRTTATNKKSNDSDKPRLSPVPPRLSPVPDRNDEFSSLSAGTNLRICLPSIKAASSTISTVLDIPPVPVSKSAQVATLSAVNDKDDSLDIMSVRSDGEDYYPSSEFPGVEDYDFYGKKTGNLDILESSQEGGKIISIDDETEIKPIPDWLVMNLEEIFSSINPKPSSKEDKDFQKKWFAGAKYKTKDTNGKSKYSKPMAGVIWNHITKSLKDIKMAKKENVPDFLLSKRAETNKEWNIQLEHFKKLSSDDLSSIRAILKECLVQTTTDTGKPLSNDVSYFNEIARMLHLAVDCNSIIVLEKINSLPKKEDRRACIDDPMLSFDALDNDLSEFMNKNEPWDAIPENIFLSNRSLSWIDPSREPIIPWTGMFLRQTFRTYRGYFTKIRTEKYCRSGQNEAGSLTNQGLLFLEDVKEIFPTENEMFYSLLLYAFFLFQGIWPTYFTREMPSEYQFDTHVPIDDNKDDNKDSNKIGKRKNSLDALTEVITKVMKPENKEDHQSKKLLWASQKCFYDAQTKSITEKNEREKVREGKEELRKQIDFSLKMLGSEHLTDDMRQEIMSDIKKDQAKLRQLN